MKTLALRTTLAVLTALAIAACENTLPTGPTASSGAAPSALADGGGGQRLGMGKGKGGGGEPPPQPACLQRPGQRGHQHHRNGRWQGRHGESA